MNNATKTAEECRTTYSVSDPTFTALVETFDGVWWAMSEHGAELVETEHPTREEAEAAISFRFECLGIRES
jgi:hypothetical protein